MPPPDVTNPAAVAGRMRDVLAADDDLPLRGVHVVEAGQPHPLVVLEPANGGAVAIEVVPPTVPTFVSPTRADADVAVVGRATARDAFVFARSDTDRARVAAAIDLRAEFRAGVRSLGTRAIAGGSALTPDEPDGEPEPARSPVFGILRAYHAAAAPRYARLLEAAVASDASTREAVGSWAGRIGVDPPAGTDPADLVARFYPVLLAGEVLLLAHEGSSGRPIPGSEATAVADRVGTRATAALRAAGTSPSVTSTTPPFDRVPADRGTDQLLRALSVQLAAARPVADPGAQLGRFYEAAIPAAMRKPTGEFFTDERIARLVARWAVPDGSGVESATDPPPIRVLDPAAGSGRFLDATADRLASLDRPGDLVGVDVNPVVLHLAAVSHAIRDPDTAIALRNASFFSIDPAGPVSTTDADRGTESGTGAGGPVDAVVGNPPFVRSGDLPMDRSHYRDHLAALDGPDGGNPAISRRADLSAYFLTHATRFLRAGGRLGFVVPSKWLAAAYGEDLREFLFGHYRVHAVVGFGTRAFDDALVDAVIVLCERCPDPATRSATPIRFLRVDAPADPADLLDTIDGSRDDMPIGDGPIVSHDGPGRTVIRRQGNLRPDGPAKLTPYLNAPDSLLSLLEDPALCPLSALATVSRGVMTGANEVFFLDEAEVAEWDIADRFLGPAQKSIRGCEGPLLDADDVDHRILDVHDYVRRVGKASDTDVDADDVIGSLRREGFDGLADYLAAAEADDHHTGRTCQRRSVWFDLGPLPTPDVFLPKLLRERVFPVRNRADAVPSNAIDCLSAREGVDPDVLHGVLLSSVVGALMEVWGRDEAGMLQLMTYETETLPVPDIRAFDGADREAVRSAASRLTTAPADPDARAALDRAVAAALDRREELAPDRIRDLRDRVRTRRLQRGDDVRILVGDGG